MRWLAFWDVLHMRNMLDQSLFVGDALEFKIEVIEYKVEFLFKNSCKKLGVVG